MVYYRQSASRGTESRFGSRTSHGELKQWCIEICSSIIGLLTLFFFLAMGGIFALLGPWVIIAGACQSGKDLRSKYGASSPEQTSSL